MAYGFRSRSKGSSSSYRRRFGGFGRFASAKARGRRVAFTRRGFIKKSGEKKYFDKTYQSNVTEQFTGNTAAVGVNLFSRGVTYFSNQWGTYTFGTQASSTATVSNNMFKELDTGVTARTRIGNKVKMNYAKGAFTFTAANVNNQVVAQGGEEVALEVGNEGNDYLRTTFRMVIVKDLQVNSTNAQITWDNVMDTSNLQAGVHSELNVDNMGRFIILSDQIFTLDADTPMKTIPFMLKGSQVGNVRYNGPTGAALTDKGYYIIWAAFVLGGNIPTTSIHCTGPTGHSRLCFTDD